MLSKRNVNEYVIEKITQSILYMSVLIVLLRLFSVFALSYYFAESWGVAWWHSVLPLISFRTDATTFESINALSFIFTLFVFVIYFDMTVRYYDKVRVGRKRNPRSGSWWRLGGICSGAIADDGSWKVCVILLGVMMVFVEIFVGWLLGRFTHFGVAGWVWLPTVLLLAVVGEGVYRIGEK